MKQQALLPKKSLSSLDESLQASNHFKVKSKTLRDYQVHRLYQKNLPKRVKNYSKASNLFHFQISRSKTCFRQLQIRPFNISSVKNTKGLMRILEAQNSPQRLDCSFWNWSFFQKACFSSKVKKFKSLLFLRLNFGFSSSSDPSEIIFMKWLCSLKNLSHFHIELRELKFKFKKILQQLFHCLLSLKKLTSLSLCFVSCENFKSAELNLLSSYLKKFTKLRALNLYLVSIKEIDDDALENLFSSLSYLQGLTQIGLHIREKTPAIPNFRVKNEIKFFSTLLDFFRGLQKTESLSDLDFDFSNCRVTYDYSPSFIVKGLFYLRRLPIRKLKLSPYEKFSDKDLRETIEILKFFSSLTNLCLDLAVCQRITKKGIAELSDPFSELSSLSSLQFIPRRFLDFTKDIAFAIKSLENLVELKLEFSGSYASDDDQMNKLASSLKNFQLLKSLDFSFEHQNYLSDPAMKSLSDGLKDLVLLQSLKLSFQSIIQLTNERVKHLADAIQKLQNLKDFSLCFWENWLTDEKIIERIGLALQCLPCLEAVYLRLYGSLRNKDILLGLSKMIKENKKNCQVIINPDPDFDE